MDCPRHRIRYTTSAGGTPVNLLDFIRTLQTELVRAGLLPKDDDFEAHQELVGMQAGDVPVTYADSSAFEKDFGFHPSVTVEEGLREFVKWYKEIQLLSIPYIIVSVAFGVLLRSHRDFCTRQFGNPPRSLFKTSNQLGYSA